MAFILPFQAISGFFALIFFYNLWTRKTKIHNIKEAPEPAGAWPLIGHLHLLGGQKPLAQILGDMADKYGPTFKIRLGVHPNLIVSSSEVVKECFTTNDMTLASRPTMSAGKFMGYDFALLGFAPYGAYWREIRKIAIVELLSNRRIEILSHVRVSEIDMNVKDLYANWIRFGGEKAIKMEMKEWFEDLTLNMVVKMVAGKKNSVGDNGEWRRFREGIIEFNYLSGIFVISDVIPFLGGWFDLNGNEKAMKRTARELDGVLEKWLEEHRNRKVADNEKDFMDVMLSIMEDGKLSSYDPNTIIKATSLSLILGGSDTTAVTLTWALSLLLTNRHVLKKAQAELDLHVGKDRHVDESDIKNLIYLQAIVKETMRLYPAAPLALPHEAIQDCNISGYHVPKGTRVMVNLWKLHRDPHVWTDPFEFQPERFLTCQAHVDMRGQHFEYIPFGSGRRSCPGISFGVQVVHLTLARLLHGFDLDTHLGEPVDMRMKLGLTTPKLTPLEVMIIPRLPSQLYM